MGSSAPLLLLLAAASVGVAVGGPCDAPLAACHAQAFGNFKESTKKAQVSAASFRHFYHPTNSEFSDELS